MPLLNVEAKPPKVKCGQTAPLRATTPLETPFFPLFFAPLQICGKCLQRGWSRVGKKTPYLDGLAGSAPKSEIAIWDGLPRLASHSNSAPPKACSPERVSQTQINTRAFCWKIVCPGQSQKKSPEFLPGFLMPCRHLPARQ